ncbi:MAG TPA: BadF/BadG/BcrA/BcrD ATPase family protein [Acidobacteriota bacterium]
MAYVIGIDGGGTKTTCLIADGRGRPLGIGRGGPGNYLREGLMVVRLSLQEAIEGARAEAGLKRQQISVVCAGLAGMDRREDKEVILRILQEIAPAGKYRLENDAYIALKGATAGKPGVVLISGTGSIAIGENAEGRRARAGGWGHVLGDEGSGYDIARRGIAAALKSFDGRGPKTRIDDKLKRQLSIRRTEEIITLLYRSGVSSSNIAGFYPIVQQAAEEGDAAALQIFEYTADELCAGVMAVVSRLKMTAEKFPICLMGGVFTDNRVLKNLVRERLARLVPNARLAAPLYPPEVGAVLLARELL